jgi:hypothetical protein
MCLFYSSVLTRTVPLQVQHIIQKFSGIALEHSSQPSKTRFWLDSLCMYSMPMPCSMKRRARGMSAGLSNGAIDVEVSLQVGAAACSGVHRVF